MKIAVSLWESEIKKGICYRVGIINRSHMTVSIAPKAHILETSGPRAIISQVCTLYNVEIWELGKEEAGKTGGGCVE